MSTPTTTGDIHRFEARLRALEALPYNVELQRQESFTAPDGWHLDASETVLPSEPAGEPVAGGAFEAAKAVLRDYRFPPPDLITGIFLPDAPLHERVMLLRARFLFFTFWFGVRVTAVIDALRGSGDDAERVWGYRYATLDGHFERGEIEFVVVKTIKTGAVRFKISSFSQRAGITNIFFRIGFSIFGRRLQQRFARESLSRMQRLVAEALQTGGTPGTAPPMLPAAVDDTADAEMHRVLPAHHAPSGVR
ncbi:MAG TPA: DUF1990 domain-containing protein [Myxococcota bacterium]